MEQIIAPCSDCLRDTNHKVLHTVHRSKKDVANWITNESYKLLGCAGCGAICLEKRWHYSDDVANEDVQYFPSPLSRKPPEWLLIFTLGIAGGDREDMIGELFEEVYAAVRGGQHRLATMGIRALLEQVMVAKVKDQGTFQKNLDAFHRGGFISLVQRDAMSAILDAGHAVTHRLYKPTARDLSIALDTAEGIFAAIYVHAGAATALADRVPKRVRLPKKE